MGTYDIYTFATCTPLCGKDTNANWQAPQEVIPTGMRNMGVAVQNVPKRNCAPLRVNQVNGDTTNAANTNTNTPPGWTQDGPPVGGE